jgi:FtsH-binding integral membrane protein
MLNDKKSAPLPDDGKSAAHVVYVDNDDHGGVSLVPKLVADMLTDRNRFMNRVFDLCFIAISITTAVAWGMSHTPSVMQWLHEHPNVIFFLLLAEVIFVQFAAAGCASGAITGKSAVACLVAYSVMNGITLTPICAIYTEKSLVTAFGSAAALFFGMSCYGYATKRDLTTPGSAAVSALWGIIAAMFINAFVGSSVVETFISVVVVVLFVGITAYDAQRIRQLGEQLGAAATMEELTGVAVVGALLLYLDFLSLFLHILRLFGSKK